MKNAKKLLIIGSIAFIISKIIIAIWWEYFAYYWNTPYFKIIEALESLTGIPVFFALSIGWIIYLFAPQKDNKFNEKQDTNSLIVDKIEDNKTSDTIKKVIFIVCLVIWGVLITRVLLSSVNGYYCSICGFNGGGGGGTTFYGLEAIKRSLLATLLMFSIVPVLPISLIYVIFYIQYLKKKKSDSIKVDKCQ